MCRRTLLLAVFLHGLAAFAQPDTLYVADDQGTVNALPVVYPPLKNEVAFIHMGHYAHDTTKLAVRMQFKRGKPSGIYRAYYPDGRPLIFAVYGWGSLHGDWTEYDRQGRVSVKGQYSNGLRHGTWTFRSEGIIGHYKKGLRHGRWKYYENDRVVRREKYHKDKLKTGSTFLLGK